MGLPAVVSRLPRRVRWISAVFVVILVATGIGLLVFARTLQNGLRDRAVAPLEDRLESDVELADLQIQPGDVLAVHGRALVVRHHRLLRRD